MGQRKAVKPKAGGQQQQQQQQLPVLQPVQAAAAAGGAGQPLHSPTGGAAAAGAGGVGGAPAVSLSTLQQLEEKKKRLRSQLKDVERQVGTVDEFASGGSCCVLPAPIYGGVGVLCCSCLAVPRLQRVSTTRVLLLLFSTQT